MRTPNRNGTSAWDLKTKDSLDILRGEPKSFGRRLKIVSGENRKTSCSKPHATTKNWPESAD
jgi:hypothetical protein